MVLTIMSERVSNKGKICSVEECENPVLARGWCRKHYSRWRSHGDPLVLIHHPKGPECSIDGCMKPVNARGWCKSHYGKWVRHGDPLVTIRTITKKMSSSERFEAQVNRDGPIPDYAPELGKCWIWTGSRNQKNYGAMCFEGRQQGAHRVSYNMFVGTIEPGYHLDHLCRQPACVNPAHLEPVTPEENNFRGLKRKMLRERTHCANGHEFTPENTANYNNGRQCRECFRILSLKYYRDTRESLGLSYKQAITSCPHGHEYTLENSGYNQKGYRICKTCNSIRGKRDRRLKKFVKVAKELA